MIWIEDSREATEEELQEAEQEPEQPEWKERMLKVFLAGH